MHDDYEDDSAALSLAPPGADLPGLWRAWARSHDDADIPDPADLDQD